MHDSFLARVVSKILLPFLNVTSVLHDEGGKANYKKCTAVWYNIMTKVLFRICIESWSLSTLVVIAVV